MGTLLEGRAHLDFSAFHQQNHHIPFVVYLGLLDLMQPHVLKHFQPLKSSFNLYFKVFQVSLSLKLTNKIGHDKQNVMYDVWITNFLFEYSRIMDT